MFAGRWPIVLDDMAAWVGDTVVAGAIANPEIVVVVDAKLVLEAKRSGANIKQDFASFRSALEERYRGGVSFGWVESAGGHRAVVDEGAAA
jgi:hypothetical protein